MAVEEYEIEWLQEQVHALSHQVEKLTERLEKLEQPLPVYPAPLVPELDLYGGTQCPKCGLVWSGVMGYVCPDVKCPIQLKVTC